MIKLGGVDLALDTRELFARLIKCEAGGEGNNGMQAVASVVMNRVNIGYGEYAVFVKINVSRYYSIFLNDFTAFNSFHFVFLKVGQTNF